MFTVVWFEATAVQPGPTWKTGLSWKCKVLIRFLWALKSPGFISDAVILLHDNSEPQTTYQTRNLLQKFGWGSLNHPPRSPDLAPSDLHPVTALKGHLSGHNFTFDESTIRWITQEWHVLFFRDGQTYCTLWKCFDRQGDYVGKERTSDTMVYCHFSVSESCLWFMGTVNLLSDPHSTVQNTGNF